MASNFVQKFHSSFIQKQRPDSFSDYQTGNKSIKPSQIYEDYFVRTVINSKSLNTAQDRANDFLRFSNSHTPSHSEIALSSKFVLRKKSFNQSISNMRSLTPFREPTIDLYQNSLDNISSSSTKLRSIIPKYQSLRSGYKNLLKSTNIEKQSLSPDRIKDLNISGSQV